jgi:alanyl aminopeptidase
MTLFTNIVHLLLSRRQMLIALGCSVCYAIFNTLAGAAMRDLSTMGNRLPSIAAPQRYHLTLTLIPGEDSFDGAVDIDLTFKRAGVVVWLNAENLKVTDAELAVAGHLIVAKTISQREGLVGISFGRQIQAGAAKLHVDYQGRLRRDAMQGIFQLKDGPDWYIYSQFEKVAARQAFPCFDEPSYKVPWQVTLIVPKEVRAFSNTPVVSETKAAGGMKTVVFAETEPIPSYLVAIAVGPMDIVEAGRAGTHHTPIRIIVPRGRSSEAYYAAEATPRILDFLEQYFGISYPSEKLDEVAIPLAGYAMEHPGLITYGADFLLMQPEKATVKMQRFDAGLIAHEMAHQWFGDLVTMAWWNDTWLNEGFASWMQNKIVTQYHPEWQTSISEISSYQDAMSTDELLSSRKVRQPVVSSDDIANAFDNITYDKGAALLRMFESYMGPDKFQQGIRRYLQKYAGGNATSSDFLESFSGGDRSIVESFSSFLEQPGVPLVTARLKCNGRSPYVQLSQKRFLPRGSYTVVAQRWAIPVCIRYGSEKGSRRVCAMLTKREQIVNLVGAAECPESIYVNDGQMGYYRVLYEDGLLKSLVNGEMELSPAERVGLIGDVSALTHGYVPLEEAMALVEYFKQDPNREVITKTLSIVGDLDDHLVPTNLRRAYQRYISDLYKPRARELGWYARPGESDDSRLLRPVLFGVLANQAEDPEFIEQARELALAWLDDHSKVDPEMVRVVLSTAARHGDRELFNRFRTQARQEANEVLRGDLLKALGSFQEPAILNDALAIVLTDEFSKHETLRILYGAIGPLTTRDLVFNFVKQHWDMLMVNGSIDPGHLLPLVVGDYCDSRHRAEVRSFFKNLASKYTGEPRDLAKILETISVCTINKNANQESAIRFLKHMGLDNTASR